jgi:hypothetical protein
MRQLRVILVTWALAGLGAGLGIGLGKWFGRQGVFLGAMVGATLAILYAMKLLVSIHWFDGDRRRGGTIGALCGLAIAAPLASIFLNLNLMIVAVLVASITGVGVLAGAGWRAAR